MRTLHIIMQMTTLNIRIDEKLKKEASKALAFLGMDTSTAVKIFLNQVIADQALPFTPSRNSKEIRKRWDSEIKTAAKQKGYKNPTVAMGVLK